MKKTSLLIGTLALSLAFTSCTKETKKEEVPVQETTMEETSHEEEMHEEVMEAQVIKLEQISGEFTNGNLELEAGTYSFEVANNGVGHDVGLVVAKKKEGEIKPEDGLANAFVTEAVKDGESQSSKGEITLEAGEYVYFCPLNPTPQYTITVK